MATSASAEVSVATTDGLRLRFQDGGDASELVVDGKPLPSGQVRGGFYAAEVRGDGKEVVVNGSLEQDADKDGTPDGGVSGGVWRRDNSVARTGVWSMKAHIPGTEDRMSGSFGVVAPVEGGATYLVSFWLKCEGRAGRNPASIGYIQQQDERGERTTEVFQHIMSGGASGTEDWRRTHMLLTTAGDTRKLYVRTDIYRGYGTLWADDFSVKKLSESAVRLPGKTTRAEHGVRLTATDPDRELRVEAVWMPEGAMLRLEGRIVSTAERDRCIRLSYRLPLAAVGGTWGCDVGTAKTIAAAGRHSRTAAFGAFGPYSVYPFSSVVTADRAAGVSLAAPMHPPRPFRIVCSANEGLAMEWDLGLSSAPELFPRSADFFAVLYRHDPAWGFRAAAARYYELFPEYFTVRVKRFGNWYYHDLNKLPNPGDFGFAYNEMVNQDTVAIDHKLGFLDFAYTEPWGWWGWALGLKPKESDPKPTYEEMIATLKQKAADQEQLAKKGMSAARTAQTILNSGIHDKDGKLRLRGGYVARWGGYNWCLNASPYAVEQGKFSRFQATYEWEIGPKLALGADGIYLDSVVRTWTDVPNYRREHLRQTRHPLTFAPLDPAPVQLGVWHHYEFIEHLSKDLHGRGKLLMANIFPHNWVFFNHLLDVLGHEAWGADNLDKMRLERTLAYHKPYTWLMQQGDDGPPQDREKWMQMAMLYGIAPNLVGGTRDPARYEKWRPLYAKYMPVIIALCEAGWEPVTHAAIEPASVLLERFGPRDGKLYLTARNPGQEPASITVALQIPQLGLPQTPTRAVRLPDTREIPIVDARFQDTLAPGLTCAYQLGP